MYRPQHEPARLIQYVPPHWLRWQSQRGVQYYELDGVSSIPAMPQRRLPDLLIISINKNVCLIQYVRVRTSMYWYKYHDIQTTVLYSIVLCSTALYIWEFAPRDI